MWRNKRDHCEFMVPGIRNTELASQPSPWVCDFMVALVTCCLFIFNTKMKTSTVYRFQFKEMWKADELKVSPLEKAGLEAVGPFQVPGITWTPGVLVPCRSGDNKFSIEVTGCF